MPNNYAFGSPGKCESVTISRDMLDVLDYYEISGTTGEIKQTGGYYFWVLDVDFGLYKAHKVPGKSQQLSENWLKALDDILAMLDEALLNGVDYLLVTI